jgi:methionyl-tRNA formyltransferase
MRIVVVGNRMLARHLLGNLLEKSWNVVGAVIPEGNLATKQANFVPFDELVDRTDCRLYETSNINSEETARWIKNLDPDVCLCGGWSQIIDETVLDIPNRGFLGLHSSRLPEGRGGAPVNWSLINGADEVWISLFYYVPGVDAGDIIAQGSVPVEFRDEVKTVFDRLALEACDVVESACSDLKADAVEAEPQSLADATYRPRRQPQDGLIDWQRSPKSQYNWIRAQTDPYPGAYTFYEGERLTIWHSEPLDRTVEDSQPGEILRIIDGEGIDVRTGNGAIRLIRLQDGNKPPQWADEYARSKDITVGDRLGRQAAPKNWRYTGIRGPSEPTRFETNLTDRDYGAIDVVSYSGSSYDLTVSATLDDDQIFEASTTVDNEYHERIEYTPEETGTHTVTVTFESGGEHIDTRHIKVFVGE